jgi:Amt family ammonium transporter
MGIDTGDTAWMLTSCIVVLMMNTPGLAIYFGGFARYKNVLSVIMQTFSVIAVVTFAYLTFGYSLAFSPVNADTRGNSVIGDHQRFWLIGIEIDGTHSNALNVPESVYCLFQLTFAIVTAALVSGSFEGKAKYGPMLLFLFLWHLVVYCPIAYWNWHRDGFLHKIGVLDFAGGNVVHISSGWAGFIATLVLGNRKVFGNEKLGPHNIPMVLLGTSMLWIGWFGFNGGSATTSGASATMSVLVTHLAASMALLGWSFTEFALTGKHTVLGMVRGAISGLVAITPASGYVDANGGIFIGIISGLVCCLSMQIKNYCNIDDAVDSLGVHVIGGSVGGLLTSFFARQSISSSLPTDGIFYNYNVKEGGRFFAIQLYGIVICSLWSIVLTYLLLKMIDYLFQMRVSEDKEKEGLDKKMHGEYGNIDFIVELSKAKFLTEDNSDEVIPRL